jgi:hypothetical protein
MRLTLIPAAALAALVLGAPADARNQDFRLINKSGVTLNRFYVSPASSNNWQSDVLGSNVLKSGRTARVNFPFDTGECLYDLRMVFETGQVVTDRIDLCSTLSYTIN